MSGRLRGVHRYGYGSARRLALVEVRDYPTRDEEHGGGGGMRRFESVLGGASAQHLHVRREGEPLRNWRETYKTIEWVDDVGSRPAAWSYVPI